MTFMKRVVLYSMSHCPHCDAAKKYLSQQNIQFRLVNVKTAAGQKEFSKSGYRGVPILKVGDQFINGFSIKEFNKLYQL
ncbi:glutaredoxin [Psychromonas ingrahamii 37]|uniref:Glutaredoxin n=2 Tax=Psychromonas ingrahamii TaxID=357794 RepID=A1SWF1_PSYIN|nr:glutaredoxin [Psychromonas ingrahamii 37]